jgi:hypothetical protein
LYPIKRVVSFLLPVPIMTKLLAAVRVTFAPRVKVIAPSVMIVPEARHYMNAALLFGQFNTDLFAEYAAKAMNAQNGEAH